MFTSLIQNYHPLCEIHLPSPFIRAIDQNEHRSKVRIMYIAHIILQEETLDNIKIATTQQIQFLLYPGP